MIIDNNKVDVYATTFSADFYKKDDYLYKVLKSSFNGSDHAYRQIKYNYEVSKEASKGLVLPNKILANNIYRMNFINGYNIDDCYKSKKLSLEDRIRIVNSLFKNLQEAHKYLIIGDVAARNCLIPKDVNDKNTYLIDFDFAAPKNAEYEALSRYKIISENGLIIPNNRQSDIAKLFIVSLNLLYQYDFEKKFSRRPKLELVRKFLRNDVYNNGFILEYFNYICNNLENNNIIFDYLVLTNTKSLKNEIEKGCQRIRK